MGSAVGKIPCFICRWAVKCDACGHLMGCRRGFGGMSSPDSCSDYVAKNAAGHGWPDWTGPDLTGEKETI